MSSSHPSRLAVETPRGRVQSGPVVDARPRTDADELHWEYLVDLGVARLWVSDNDDSNARAP